MTLGKEKEFKHPPINLQIGGLLVTSAMILIGILIQNLFQDASIKKF